MLLYGRGIYNKWILIRITHWGRVTHICVDNLTIIGSDNGLSPGRRQAIIWTNAWILSIGPLGTNFIEMLIKIHTFSFRKMHSKCRLEKTAILSRLQCDKRANKDSDHWYIYVAAEPNMNTVSKGRVGLLTYMWMHFPRVLTWNRQKRLLHCVPLTNKNTITQCVGNNKFSHGWYGLVLQKQSLRYT